MSRLLVVLCPSGSLAAAAAATVVEAIRRHTEPGDVLAAAAVDWMRCIHAAAESAGNFAA